MSSFKVEWDTIGKFAGHVVTGLVMAFIVMFCDGGLDLLTEWAGGFFRNAFLVVILHGLADITLLVDAGLFVTWVIVAFYRAVRETFGSKGEQ